MTDEQKRILDAFHSWYERLDKRTETGGRPSKGLIAATLVLLERLKSEPSLDPKRHTTDKGAQVKSASGTKVAKILNELGESRCVSREGGRTSRGTLPKVTSLLETLEENAFSKLSKDDRIIAIVEMQRHLAAEMSAILDLDRLVLPYAKDKPTRTILSDLFESARLAGKEAAIAEYLVGAKLSLRFPNVSIRNTSFTTADTSDDEPGDFVVNDFSIHVTIAPSASLIEKCRKNVDNNYRPLILVTPDVVDRTRQSVYPYSAQIEVLALEDFSSQNIDEISEFSTGNLRTQLIKLIERYNDRVTEVDPDSSKVIELPRKLKQKRHKK